MDQQTELILVELNHELSLREKQMLESHERNDALYQHCLHILARKLYRNINYMDEEDIENKKNELLVEYKGLQSRLNAKCEYIQFDDILESAITSNTNVFAEIAWLDYHFSTEESDNSYAAGATEYDFDEVQELWDEDEANEDGCDIETVAETLIYLLQELDLPYMIQDGDYATDYIKNVLFPDAKYDQIADVIIYVNTHQNKLFPELNPITNGPSGNITGLEKENVTFSLSEGV